MTLWTRRQFLENTGRTGLAMAAFSALSMPARAELRRGGSVKFGVPGGATTDSLDPAGGPDTHLALIWWAIRNSLTEVTETGELVGEVAESWEASPDAKKWIFKLRKGIESHNGKTLTAEDVIASLNYHRGESKSGGKVLVEAITDIKADGDNTIAVTLSDGNADFPYLLSDYHLLIMPAKDGKADWESGIGTSGYALEHFEPGVTAKLKRFPNYYKGGTRAHFDEVELLNINDTTARQAALMSGEADAIGRVDIKTVASLAAAPDLRIVETTGAQYSSILMRADTPPFNNNDVRQALKYAIDRKKLLANVLQGHGTIGNDQPIGPTYRYFASDIAQADYDPDKAKFRLKKAGFDRLKVQLETAEVAWPMGAVDSALLYSDQAKAAGIDIEVVRKPDDAYWSNVWMQAPLCMGYISGRPTEDWIFTAFYAADAHYNDTYWKNARFEALLKAGRAELDDHKRRDIYREMQQILHDDGGLIAPLFGNHVIAVSNKIAMNSKISGNWEMDNWRAVERWAVSA
jgi:peptide/nickel transport system substrate-binding protein